MVACFHLIMISNYILVNASNTLLKTIHILNFFGTWRMEKILYENWSYVSPYVGNPLMCGLQPLSALHLVRTYMSFK